MQVYTVHEPSDEPADTMDRAARLVFVRDGFSLAAAIAGPIWMAVSRLWLVLLGYLAITLAIVAAVALAGVGAGWGALLIAALHLVAGFEASSLRRWTLERRGWQLIATVGGRNREDCERRFFETWLASQPMLDASRLGRAGGDGSGLSGLAGQLGPNHDGAGSRSVWRFWSSIGATAGSTAWSRWPHQRWRSPLSRS